jgi:GT2 family glycosyltransferase
LNIAVLITCYNRKQTTLACLEALYQNSLPRRFALDVFLVDDGSTDGTGKSIKAIYPSVNVINGDGNLYWNGGMRLAFASAMKKGYNYYLWLNDDTILYPHAIRTLVSTAYSVSDNIKLQPLVIGSTKSINGSTTYGGLVKTSFWRPLKFNLVVPKDIPVECDTMNGNCVLITEFIASKLGNLDENFIQMIGDVDYGLRAKHIGIRIFVMPEYAGQCEKNLPHNTFNDNKLSIRIRLNLLLGKKGLPLDAWKIFTKRHGGFFWWVYWLLPYVKVLISPIFFR